MKDKLIELIKSGTGINHNGKCDICQTADCIGCLADYLIDHGVTIATDNNVAYKWIPVEEELPEINQDVLMYFDAGNMAAGFWHDGDETITFWCSYSDDGWYTDCDSEPTHWMPLPMPPKEDNNAGD